ncbi:MAG: hypothetical protein LBU83_07500 [Bacteroidales bacterium]|nr:hypothetical protein [Bacteroidales bacterium]
MGVPLTSSPASSHARSGRAFRYTPHFTCFVSNIYKHYLHCFVASVRCGVPLQSLTQRVSSDRGNTSTPFTSFSPNFINKTTSVAMMYPPHPQPHSPHF